MDKDVKLALLLWPTLASTALVAATSLPLCWNADGQPSRSHSVAVGTSTLSCIFGYAHRMMSPKAGDEVGPVDAGVPIADSLGDSPKARSLQDADPAHRPDHGLRGLAMPIRLAGGNVGMRGNDGRDGSSRTTSPHADSVASSRVIARTLLAPVLDPVAELAGYSGLALTSPLAMPSDAAPMASPTLPSIFSPGMEDPLSATGTRSGAQPGSQSASRMTSINPIASWNAIADQRVAEARRRAPQSLIPQSLIPQSVAVLAKPNREPAGVSLRLPTRSRSSLLGDHVSVGNPVTWPRPQQLCQDLAVIASDADMTRVFFGKGGSAALTSAATGSLLTGPSDRGSLLRELVVGGDRYPAGDAGTTSLQRQASAMVMGRWADQVERTLEELRALPRIGDNRSGQLIRTLTALSEAGLQIAERVPARDQQVRWLRASHALSRRAAVWGPIWQLARQSDDPALSSASQDVTSVPGDILLGPDSGYSLTRFQTDASEIGEHVATLTGKVRNELDDTGDRDGWIAFLLLDEIEAAAASDEVETRALVAQRFLSRLDHHSLQGDHREWLRRDSLRDLASAMQTWTAQPIDYARLLGDLERGETDSIDLAAIKVSEAFQSLRFSDDLDAARVAKAIDVTYRNANVRMAISVDLIDRLLPPVAPITEPIRTTLLGNTVRGTSTVNSQLGLTLQPSRDSWNLAIMTDGNVQTSSRSGQSGVTVMSSGNNTFAATTPLIIRPDGYHIGQTRVDVSGNQRLRGVRSRYDGWPLVGSLVRGIAEARFAEVRPIAQRVSNDRIRNEVTQELQTQLLEKTSSADLRLDDLVFGPLGRLDLDPMVIDLKTTPRRLIARYRLAGDWQLASNTPRPRAWSDSWLSLQIHQSALNNTMERLLPTGQSKTIQRFHHDTMELFGREAGELPEEVPADAMIEFAATRPITIEVDDGKLSLTIRVVSLSQPDGAALRRFIVRGTYRPEINGLDAHLVRDGHLSISGPGMSMRQRIPLRALFNKILSESRTIPLTTARLIEHPAAQGLAISQLELRDGWIALAISPETSNRIAIGTRSAVPR